MLYTKELISLRSGRLAATSLLSGEGNAFGAVVAESFLIISAAEIFDKTFFIVMILTATQNKWAVFLSACAALWAHVGICASAGILVAQYMSKTVTIGLIVSVYLTYAILFFIAYWQAPNRDKPAEQDGMEEAHADLLEAQGSVSAQGGSAEAQGGSEAQGPEAPGGSEAQGSQSQESQGSIWTGFWVSFWLCFSAVFLGEFGDRTQFAMVGQTSNYPLWPVCLGCSAAFLVQVCFSMLAGELLLRLGITHGTLLLFGAISFFAFAIFALVYQD